MIYLHKLLPIFLLPLGATLVAVLVGLITGRKSIAWIGIAILWLSSLPLVSSRFIRMVEGGAVRQAIAEAPTADAIVVLSGGMSVAPGTSKTNEWGDPDRFFAGIDLLQGGKAPVIVFTGGWVPWAHGPLEGQVLREWALKMGVAEKRIVTTGAVLTTAEEAAAVRATLDRTQTNGVGHARDVWAPVLSLVLMPKLAWFSPLSPVKSGIAQYSAELLPAM